MRKLFKKIFDYIFLDKMPSTVDEYGFKMDEIDDYGDLFDVPLLSREKLVFLSLFIDYLYIIAHKTKCSGNIYGYFARSQNFLLHYIGEDFLRFYGVLELNNEIYSKCISENFQDYTHIETLASWIITFWEYGLNILELLYFWIGYTEEFFTKGDIIEAIRICEEKPELKNKKLMDEWNYLLETIG